MTQVQTTLLALASMVSVYTVKRGHCLVRSTFRGAVSHKSSVTSAPFHQRVLSPQAKTKGMDTKVDIGVKYADKKARHFDDEKIKAGQCVIGLQVTVTW